MAGCIGYASDAGNPVPNGFSGNGGDSGGGMGFGGAYSQAIANGGPNGFKPVAGQLFGGGSSSLFISDTGSFTSRIDGANGANGVIIITEFIE